MFLLCFSGIAFGAEKEHKIFQQVSTIDDIPENECREVVYPPSRLDRLTLSEPRILCNTLGIVIIPQERKVTE